MRKYAVLWVALLLLVGVGAIKYYSDDFYIINSADNVKLKIRNSAAQTQPWVEIVEGDTLRFAVPATGILAVEHGGTGNAIGSAATAATATNLTSAANIATGTLSVARLGGFTTNVTIGTDVFWFTNGLLGAVTPTE